jgi:putative transposase
MPQLIKAIKLELDGEEFMFRVLDGQSRICNWLYNHLLDFANSTKKQAIETNQIDQAKVIYTERGLRDLLPSLKERHLFLKTVYSSPLKNTAFRLSTAIQEHQRGKKGKRKNRVGWPRFRSWKAKWFSLLYDEPDKGYKVEQDVLKISLGVDENKKRLVAFFRLKDANQLRGYQIRNMRISKTHGRYYATFTVQVEIPDKKPIRSIIALDPNHKNLVYGVDNRKKAIEVEGPHWLKLHDKKLDELKSRRDRCLKKARKCAVVDTNGQPTGKSYYLPSRQWSKRHERYERELHRCREQKKTYMCTVAHSLCRDYDCIGIGDYAPQGDGLTRGMRRAMNNRSLIGQFKDVLFWTASKSGKTVVEYNEEGTTRTCHACGYVVCGGLNPSIRSWHCPECTGMHIRDENAAINGHRRILRDLQEVEKMQVFSVPRSGHVSIEKRCVWRVLPSGVVKLRGGRMANDSQRQKMKSKV